MTDTNEPADRPTDAERIRILATPERPSTSGLSTRGGSDNSTPADHSGNWQRKPSTIQKENLFEDDYAFYNTAFNLADGQETKEEDLCSSFGIENNRFNPDMSGQYAARNLAAADQENFKLCNNNKQNICIQRNPNDYSFIQKQYGIVPKQNSPISQNVKQYLKSQCTCNLAWLISFITSLVPVLSWLPKYKLEFLVPDLIAGFTIAILHIPQGMAYGILASVKPENGLYVSFFPVLVYFILGTSRHISIGTFAVISLMMSSAVANINAVPLREYNNITSLNETNSSIQHADMMMWPPTHLEIATTMALAVGFWQLFMGVFQLGALTVVLSDQLVSGFSTGAACHVATSQLKDLFGISVKNYNGVLKLIYMFRDIFYHLGNSNVATVIISAISIFTLAVVKEQVNDRFKNKLKMPIPVDLVVVIISTAISYFMNLKDEYGVKVMEDIPIGLPAPTSPRLDFILQLLTDSFAIAIVAFAISLSMAKLFSKKHKYEIRANQELVALGCANVFSSFFACYPCSASLSRSLVQERAGGKTQVAGVVSCIILLLVLLVLAPLFFSLPKAILSAVILVALKGMFLQVMDFINSWRISKLDAFIWLVTFLSTVLLDVSYGLLTGVIFSILTVIIRTMWPSRTLLGNIPDTDVYLDLERYSEAKEIGGVKIFHFESALYFVNRELFKSSLQKLVPLTDEAHENEETRIKSPKEDIRFIIVDCSTFSYVDMSGLETLLEVMKEYNDVEIKVFLAGCSVSVCDLMERANFFKMIPYQPSVFPAIHDAVKFLSNSDPN